MATHDRGSNRVHEGKDGFVDGGGRGLSEKEVGPDRSPDRPFAKAQEQEVLQIIDVGSTDWVTRIEKGTWYIQYDEDERDRKATGGEHGTICFRRW